MKQAKTIFIEVLQNIVNYIDWKGGFGAHLPNK